MEIDQELEFYSFHATWGLKNNLAKPFDVLLKQINQHINNETHETFKEEGMLFKSYLYMSGIGESKNKDKGKATECLNDVMLLLDKWNESPMKDGFLSVAYALEAWIDMDKTELRLRDLKQLYYSNSHDTRNHFEAAIHFIKGYSLSRLGQPRYAQCIAEFQKANEKFPENHEYLFSVALMTRRLYGCSDDVGKKLERMLREVLKKNEGYLYAKAELAVVINSNGNTSGATELLEEITSTLATNESITPENMKILGHVMETYLNMGKLEKADETYNIALRFNQQLNTFVVHQKAILEKKRGNLEYYKTHLEEALTKNSFNLLAKLELAQQVLPEAKVEDVNTKFEGMISAHENDKFALVQIMSHYGTMLMGKGDDKRAYARYMKAMDIAFKYCQCNPDEKSHTIKFYNEVKLSVKICVQNLRKQLKNNIKDPEVIRKLVKLEYKLRNKHLTHFYCNEALQMVLSEEAKSEITCILAEIVIELSVDVSSLTEVDEMLNNITPSAKLTELQRKLSYKRGILHERANCMVALKEHINAAKDGYVDAIQRILRTLEIMDTTQSKFYEVCASVDTSITSMCVGVEKENMRRNFEIVLENAISGNLRDLRKQQFEMEKALLTENGCSVCCAGYVMQICRNLLNYAMNNLSKRYCESDTGNTLDFFCVHRNFDKEQTEEKIRSKLKQYKWENVDDELITFLVETQPCKNPRANNWIMAFMEFNNTDKHKEQNKQYGEYKVYSEGAQPQSYQVKEYYSIDLARTVCNNIAYILDNLNGFSLSF